LVAQGVGFQLEQVHLVWVAVKASGPQSFQNNMHILAVLFQRVRPHNNVIQVDVANFP
jgi:hypothetical protein